MFPHPCGDDFAMLVAAGADPTTVVPDDYVVVRGGTKPIPTAGQEYSAHVGPTLDAAAAAVPYGQVRVTTAGEIRRAGGIVNWYPQPSRHGTANNQHVHVTEMRSSILSALKPNPVPKNLRIDGGR
jgi:hypothetical protein